MTSKSTKQQRPKHIPQRTCVACRSTEAKRGMVRVVRTADGSVTIDETGKKPGRGAYVHKSRECWDKALKGKVLEYALKTAIASEDKVALQAYGETLQSDEEIVASSE